jgi:hypothetical protein
VVQRAHGFAGVQPRVPLPRSIGASAFDR